jgi:pilus assembly protein CpaB
MSRRILAVAAALLLALFGTGAMFAYVSNADERALAGQEAVTVLMAAKEIPAGTSAADAEENGLVREDVLPQKAVPTGVLDDLDKDVATRVATAAIAPGQVLTRAQFGTAATTTAGLPVPDGTVAVSVEMTRPGHVGGFVEPGVEIAVYDTFNTFGSRAGSRPSGDRISDRHEYLRDTRVLLPRVSVLAVGDATTAKGDGGDETTDETADTGIVTIAVTPADAAKLVHGANTGTLYFALLNASTDVESGQGADDTNLFD